MLFRSEPRKIRELRFVFDSDLNRKVFNMPCNFPLKTEPYRVPQTLVRAFRIEVEDELGQWRTALRVENNYQRLVKLAVDLEVRALRFVPEATWGTEEVLVFAWDIS